jgi:hypothetical protein
MKPIYKSNIQPLQGFDIQFIDDRGFTPTVIQIVPLRGTNCIKSNASVVILVHKLCVSVINNNLKFFEYEIPR